MLERETDQRFPWAFVQLLSQSHILPFHPGLCSPVIPVLLGVALHRLIREPEMRSTERPLLTYLCFVAMPIYCFYAVFMGDMSTIIKLQSVGILLLLPLAGLGGEVVLGWLLQRWKKPHLAALALHLALGGVTLGVGWGTLRQTTTLQLEYQFLLDLRQRVPPGTRVHHLPAHEPSTHLNIPRVIARRSGAVLLPMSSAEAVLPAKGDLVFLGAGCLRFQDSEVIPGSRHVFRELLFRRARDRPLSFGAMAIFNLNRANALLMDHLRVEERAECRSLKSRLGLEPFSVVTARRSTLEGRLMPRELPFGLFRVTAQPDLVDPVTGPMSARAPGSQESAPRVAAWPPTMP